MALFVLFSAFAVVILVGSILVAVNDVLEELVARHRETERRRGRLDARDPRGPRDPRVTGGPTRVATASRAF